MKAQDLNRDLIAEFIARGGEVTICKPKRAKRRDWFSATKGRATAFAHLRKCDAARRGARHDATDASYVAI